MLNDSMIEIVVSYTMQNEEKEYHIGTGINAGIVIEGIEWKGQDIKALMEEIGEIDNIVELIEMI